MRRLVYFILQKSPEDDLTISDCEIGWHFVRAKTIKTLELHYLWSGFE